MWLIIILIIISTLWIIFITPSLFENDTESGNSLDKPNHKRTERKSPKPSNKWDGPKTDTRINEMLAECITLLKNLNVPISRSICPTVKLIGARRTLGRCCKRGSRKKYSEYEYYIEISAHTLGNTEKSLRNTLIHELLHTVPDGMRHTGAWKKWAKYVSRKTGYTIQRLGGDETAGDIKRLSSDK